MKPRENPGSGSMRGIVLKTLVCEMKAVKIKK
jgi:hypothetical protein